MQEDLRSFCLSKEGRMHSIGIDAEGKLRGNQLNQVYG